MKIDSEYTDFYDHLAEGSTKRPVYKRHMRTDIGCFKRYRRGLLDAKIGTGTAMTADIHIEPFVNYQSSNEYIKVTPMVLGIAGKLYLIAKYENSVLNMTRYYHTYDNLSRVFKNDLLKRSFDMANSGACPSYCFAQFDCVNFLMWYNEDKLILCKEPKLTGIGTEEFLSPDFVYAMINTFLLQRKEKDTAYKSVALTQYQRNQGL